MVTLTTSAGSLELPNCELAESTITDMNAITHESPGGAVSNKRRLVRITSVHQFNMQLLTREQCESLITYIKANYARLVTFDTGPSPLGIFEGVILHDPFQVVERGNNIFDAQFKVMLNG